MAAFQFVLTLIGVQNNVDAIVFLPARVDNQVPGRRDIWLGLHPARRCAANIRRSLNQLS
jgi:hypothetical protein